MKITLNNAKKIIARALEERQLSFTKLTARTINFSDLARGDCVFVAIHGWQPNPAWDDLKTLAKSNGFCIETN